jgi:phage terminase large subunit
MFEASEVYDWNLQATEDVIVNQGGTSSGKTYSILQVLFTYAVKEQNTITVVGQDIPNLKTGALKDALDIYGASPQLQALVQSYNKSERIFHFKTGSTMHFTSFENAQDAKSGKRDYLFINEAQGVNFGIFDELHTRTKKQTFIDYNPNAEFWVHRELIGRPTTRLIISTYKNNPFAPKKSVEKIEARMEDTEWFDVYGKGKTGRIEGLIFRNWFAVPTIDPNARFIGYWLDFGFTNDVTSFGEVYLQNGELWINQLIYETGLVNVLPKDSKHYIPNINDKLKGLGINPNREIIADSAEQKSIEELSNCGWNIKGVKKYAGSIKDGIEILKRYRINVTQRSTETRKEFNSYRWKVDPRTNENLNEPVDVDNHSIDGVRYVGLEKLGNDQGSGRYSII